MERLKHVFSFVGFIAVTVVTAATFPTTASAVLPGIPQRVEQLETTTSDLDFRVDGLEATAPQPFPGIQSFSSAYVKAYAAPTHQVHARVKFDTGVAPTLVVTINSCNWDGPPDWNPYCPEEPSAESATLAVPFTPDNTGPYTFNSGPEFDTLTELVTNGEHGHVNFWQSRPGEFAGSGNVLDESAVFGAYMAPGEYDLKDRYTLHSVIVVVDQFKLIENIYGELEYDVIARAIFRLETVSQ